MLACRAIVAAVLVTAAKGCSFPPDHPSFSQSDSQNSVNSLGVDVLHVYTDHFEDCSGCVTELNVCYTPGVAAPHRETILTVIIITDDNVIAGTHDITVNPVADRTDGGRTNCRAASDGLDQPYCCVTQTLEPAQQFVVNSSFHYAMRTYSGVSVTLLHISEQTAGYTLNPVPAAVVGSTVSYSSVMRKEKPMFYFNLTQGNCPSETPSPEPSVSTTADSISPSTSTSTSLTSTSTGSHDTSATPTATNNMAEDSSQQGQGASGSTSALVGGVVGVVCVVVGGALVVVLVLVVVLCVKRRKRKVVRQEGVTNALYGAGGGLRNDEPIFLEAGDKDSYCTPIDAVPNNTYITTAGVLHPYDHIDDLPQKTDMTPTPYTYASSASDPNPLTSPDEYSYAVTGAEIANGRRASKQEESIYEAPANSEHALYAQYAKIRVTNIPLSKVKVTELIGSGQFGNVNKGVWQSPRGVVEVAIKTLKSSALQEDRIKFLQEGAIMGQFRHPNVVQLHGVVRQGKTVLLVIELLAKTDLKEHLTSLRPSDGAEDASLPHTLLSYCRQVASGMDYLSKKGFVHRDIAARNILISEDRETCKIADFGMSRDLADETYYISSGGKIPVKWTAPEALHYKKYSTASDVWSFGCLMYEIWSLGHKPFEDHRNADIMKMVDHGFRLPPPPGCPRAIYCLMIMCWHPTTSDRPTSTSIVQSLSRSDPALLKWEESDKPAGNSLALQLGAPLEASRDLYGDLQKTFLPESSDNDYECVS